MNEVIIGFIGLKAQNEKLKAIIKKYFKAIEYSFESFLDYQIVLAEYGTDDQKGCCQYWKALKVILLKKIKTKDYIV